jgi:hypothetical protein
LSYIFTVYNLGGELEDSRWSGSSSCFLLSGLAISGFGIKDILWLGGFGVVSLSFEASHYIFLDSVNLSLECANFPFFSGYIIFGWGFDYGVGNLECHISALVYNLRSVLEDCRWCGGSSCFMLSGSTILGFGFNENLWLGDSGVVALNFEVYILSFGSPYSGSGYAQGICNSDCYSGNGSANGPCHSECYICTTDLNLGSGIVECLWTVGIECFLASVLENSGSGVTCRVGLGYKGGLLSLKMEPSWSEIKHILRRHEEISEANHSTLHQLSVKMGNLEQTVSNLTQCIESLET